MPELPEVETVRRGLSPVLAGQRLARVEARRPDLRFPLPEGFVQRLTGAVIQRLDRRAKYLLAPLDRGETLVMHLGMSGRFEIARPEGVERPGEFHYAPDPDPSTPTWSSRPRPAAGSPITTPGASATWPWSTPPRCSCIPGSPPWDPSRCRTPSTPPTCTRLRRAPPGPKTLLLDQRIVAGLGNIYVCEALNRARISPFKPAGTIFAPSSGQIGRDHPRGSRGGHRRGGSTLRDYAAADGALGYFQHRFRVYDREGQPCTNAKCRGVIARQVQGGRSTFYCPDCQT